MTILFYVFTVSYMLYSINYSLHLSNNLHLSEYNPFSHASKEVYIKKYLRLYGFFEYLNNNTPENSIIYEAFTGGRGYYANRVFYSDTTSLDRYLLELAQNGALKEDYTNYFENLPNSNLKATHLLIRPNSLVKIFHEMNQDEKDLENSTNENKLQGYIQYINSLKILKTQNDIYLFKL